MALEPAGISLEAQNFRKYISQLGKIEKAQQSIFNVDSSKLDNAFSKAERSSKSLDTSLQSATKKGAAGFSALGTAASVGFAAVATAAVVAVAAVAKVTAEVFNLSQQTDQASKDIAARLGISATEAADKYNESLQNIFVDNPQAQFAEIADAIALTERALDIDTAGLEQVAGDVLKISQQFNQNLPKTVGAAEQLIEQFGLSGQEATDLIAFGLQNIPADDLIDTIGEYSNQFSQAGFTANEFFSILQTGTAGGILGTDKIADATKEFQIRFLEGNKTLKDSFKTLGLDFNQLTQQVNSGQRTIADVFGVVVNRAGEVDLSVASNRAAIAGLGTQFEDLGASAVAGLSTSVVGFDNVTGSADKLNERFNNIGDAFTSVSRSALVALSPIGDSILELVNSFIPKIKAGFEAIRPAIEAFANRIGPAIDFAGEAFDRLLKSLGGATGGVSALESVLNGAAVVIEGLAGGVEILARVTETFRQGLAFARAGIAAFGSIVNDVFNAVLESFGLVGRAFTRVLSGDFKGALEDLSTEVLNFDSVLDNAGAAAVDAFKGAIFREADGGEAVSIPVEAEVSIDTTQANQDIQQQAGAIKLSEEALKSYQNQLTQAEQLQRSFARAAEDSALKLARANEDIARKQSQQVSKLQENQAKDRDKLLKDQAKQLDKFEADRRKQIAKAEKNIREARKEAGEQQKREQQKLQRELQQAQERFNLSQLQSERRFSLQESRLRAEGDILGLKELREDFALQQQEEKENFDLSKKEQVSSAKEQQKEQAKDLENKVKELKSSLEEQRAELLASFDEQLASQREAQLEARAEQQRVFEEQAAERAIQLAREEEDRRISQARQLEDLGRSFAEQEGVTQEGTEAIAAQLEKVFGIDGTADNIINGFTSKTKNEFTTLFEDLEKIVSEAEIEPETPIVPITRRTSSGGGFGGRLGGVQEFADGGIVAGPVGSPQPAIVHGGETVLPTHRQAFTMQAPAIPSQSLNVNMSGGFNISGDGQADEQILQAAAAEMTENFRIAVQRIARRN